MSHEYSAANRPHLFLDDQEETIVPEREDRAQKAAANFARMAKNARERGNHAVATMAEQQAAQAAETARIKYDWIQETMPAVMENLARFYETGEPQLIIDTEQHSFNDELFDNIYAAAGVNPVDFMDEERQLATVPLSPEIQHALGLPESQIEANVCDSSMAGGGMLYNLNYMKHEQDADGQTTSTEQFMILASNFELPPIN